MALNCSQSAWSMPVSINDLGSTLGVNNLTNFSKT